VEQLGTGSGAERVEAFSEPALQLVGSHGRRLRRLSVTRPFRVPVHIRSCRVTGVTRSGAMTSLRLDRHDALVTVRYD
jgi:hypothetical protein